VLEQDGLVRRSCRGPGVLLSSLLADRADEHREVAEPCRDELARGADQSRLRAPTEGRAQREILDRVPRHRHLGEHDEVRARVGRASRPLDDRTGVGLEVADAGVDLRQGDA
jgi:hypothetical protein